MVFQFKKEDTLLIGIAAKQKGTTAQWHSNILFMLQYSLTLAFLQLVLLINLFFLKILPQTMIYCRQVRGNQSNYDYVKL